MKVLALHVIMSCQHYLSSQTRIVSRLGVDADRYRAGTLPSLPLFLRVFFGVRCECCVVGPFISAMIFANAANGASPAPDPPRVSHGCARGCEPVKNSSGEYQTYMGSTGSPRGTWSGFYPSWEPCWRYWVATRTELVVVARRAGIVERCPPEMDAAPRWGWRGRVGVDLRTCVCRCGMLAGSARAESMIEIDAGQSSIGEIRR
jgi:hypothetical protein